MSRTWHVVLLGLSHGENLQQPIDQFEGLEYPQNSLPGNRDAYEASEQHEWFLHRNQIQVSNSQVSLRLVPQDRTQFLPPSPMDDSE